VEAEPIFGLQPVLGFLDHRSHRFAAETDGGFDDLCRRERRASGVDPGTDTTSPLIPRTRSETRSACALAVSARRD
jgi:hypothetical protein